MVLPLPIFVINLPRDTERHGHMTMLLRELGLRAESTTAVDGNTLLASDRAAYDRARALRVYGVEMMDTEIGCYLSHYRIYEQIVRENIETSLIMEDDVSVEPTFLPILESILSCPFTDWEVIRLDCKRDQVIRPLSERFRGMHLADLAAGAALYRLHTRVLGLGAYLIRREGAARMLAYGKRIFMPIDQTMDRYWENGIVPYIVRPFPVYQLDSLAPSTGSRSPDRRRAQPLRVKLQRRLQRAKDGLRKRLFNLLN